MIKPAALTAAAGIISQRRLLSPRHQPAAQVTRASICLTIDFDGDFTLPFDNVNYTAATERTRKRAASCLRARAAPGHGPYAMSKTADDMRAAPSSHASHDSRAIGA